MTEFVRKRLTELIDASGIPPSRLSEMLYLNPGYFSDVRRGKQIVSYDVLSQVCDYFHITLSEFFDPDYSLKRIYREVNLLCQGIPEDQIQEVILPVLKHFAGLEK